MIRRFHSVLGDERGTTLIEMGFVLPVLCFLVLGIADVSVAFSDKLALEQAGYRALEKIQQSGYTHSTATTNDLTRLEDDAEAAAGAGSTATAEAYLECRNGTQAPTELAYNSACQTGWTSARYVAVAIRKSHTPAFGGLTGTITLTGEASIRVQ